MYLRQQAWLDAVPPDLGTSRRQFIARHKGEDRAAEYEVDPGPLSWMIDLLDDAGRVRLEVGGMGGGIYLPLRWVDIEAWQRCTGQALEAGTLRGLIHLSTALAGAMNAARELETQAPFEPE